MYTKRREGKREINAKNEREKYYYKLGLDQLTLRIINNQFIFNSGIYQKSMTQKRWSYTECNLNPSCLLSKGMRSKKKKKKKTNSSIKQMTLQTEYKTEIAMYSVLGSINGVAQLQCSSTLQGVMTQHVFILKHVSTCGSLQYMQHGRESFPV